MSTILGFLAGVAAAGAWFVGCWAHRGWPASRADRVLVVGLLAVCLCLLIAGHAS
jgi:hypothetical protein